MGTNYDIYKPKPPANVVRPLPPPPHHPHGGIKNETNIYIDAKGGGQDQTIAITVGELNAKVQFLESLYQSLASLTIGTTSGTAYPGDMRS